MRHDDTFSGVFDSATGAAIQVSDPTRVLAGRYEIMERIGGGGMGQVVRARHLRLDKIFAIKLMKAELTQDPEIREVFIREATLASRLSHPNIVSVVDFGDDPDWGLFIVMELAEGEPLSDRIDREGPLPVHLVCDIAEQLIAAMGHSHDNDVVHGDIKAENVSCLGDMLGDQRDGTVSLIDFGMAHLASTGRRAGRVSGTPAYMAPERITGGPPQPSIDIYAFGILMYEMLAGSVPFDDEDPEAVLRLHLHGTPPPLADKRGEPVDDQLVAFVARAMARDLDERYQNAAELAADLSSYMRSSGLPQRHRGRRMSTLGDTDRSTEALAVFDSLGVPAAGLDVDGIIVIANSSMARLLGRSVPGDVEGGSIFETSLGKAGTLRDDVRLAAMDGKQVRRRFTAGSADNRISMRFVLTPAKGATVSCTVALHRLAR